MTDVKTSEQIRQEFLDFFREKDHEIVASDSLVPHNDPTLLFTNAGMNQFKDVFLGAGERPYVRAADTQKCLRVSGKHNDLEEVGVDTYHHTFFEMLGNWSFGDYFKKEVIAWAWELLVDRWGLDPARLYVTVHEGDSDLDLGPDDEAAGFWKSETGIDPEHILYCPTKDNFWMMGDTGPCGPCSEVHIDLRSDADRKKLSGASLVNADDPRVMEIWNLVFIQYDAQIDGSLQPLPAQHVDTGMGFERVVAVLQAKNSNYDTDLFETLLEKIARLSPLEGLESYDRIKGSADEVERIRVAMRVVSDHVRTITFAVSDGVSPGNVGRGYVIRRILRRAVRFGYQTLELRKPFLYLLVDALVDKMSGPFPDIDRNRDYIERIVRAEEESFLETLGTGLSFFDQIIPYVRSIEQGADAKEVQKSMASDRQTMDLLTKAYVDVEDASEIPGLFADTAAHGNLPGQVAFLLHDTYGFPVDLTRLMARETGLGIDMDSYTDLMQQQKDRARAAATFVVSDVSDGDWRTISEGAHSEFVGYDEEDIADAVIRRVRTVESKDGQLVSQLILDRTPFYSESGGQIGDTGILLVGDEQVRVLDTRRANGDVIHFVDRLPDELDGPVRASIEAPRRMRIKKHHTATHLLHAALREVLGPHVAQKGSLVAPDHLRFDFSHYERVTPEQLDTVARIVNEKVQENVAKMEEQSVPIDEALERGAMALFGEKYGDRVRVITFDPSYSVELCGGTHVDATGEIGVFAFRHEGSIAAGVRRVEAIAGLDALAFMQSRIDELDRVRGHFKTLQRPTDEEVADLLERNKSLSKEMGKLKSSSLGGIVDEALKNAIDVSGIRVAVANVGEADMESLRSTGQQLRDRAASGTVGVLGAVDASGEKALIVAVVTDDVIAGSSIKAGDVVSHLARIVGGGGGGRPEMATAGGKNPDRLAEALAEAQKWVASRTGA
ncbi:MAG: alanine--tRNA ligase [Rhodothermales bacterium]|nr:alanine--tRNA ligase [Rhodothermales bacterium]